MVIDSEKDLADAVGRGEDYIEVTGDLANKVLKVKAVGKVSWALAIGLIGVLAYGAYVFVPAAVATGGGSAPVQGIAGTALGASIVAILGPSTAVAAIALAVAAGGAGTLNRLRDQYEVAEGGEGRVVLRKKNSN